MYKIAICDDDKDYIKELKDIILESNEKRLAIEFYDFDCGEKLLHSKVDDMDVIFLDIQMGGMNGNETAVRLNKRDIRGYWYSVRAYLCQRRKQSRYRLIVIC